MAQSKMIFFNFDMSADLQKPEEHNQSLAKNSTKIIEKQYDQQLKAKYLEYMHEKDLKSYKQEKLKQIKEVFGYRADRNNLNFQIQVDIIQKTCQVLNLFVNYRQYRLLMHVLNVKGSSKCHKSYSVFQGNFSKVFKVKHPDGNHYAVKCFHINDKNFKAVFEGAVKEYFLYYFASVLKAAPAVRSQNCFHLIVYDDCIEFFMEFGDYSLKEKTIIEKDLLQSLKYLHAFRLVHCDIKPENICYSQKYQKHVFLDFGFSALIQEQLGYKTQTTYKGTLQYCSTDMVNCFYEKVSKRVDLHYNDIWALKKSIQQISKKRQRDESKLTYNQSLIQYSWQDIDFSRLIKEEQSTDLVYQLCEQVQFLLVELKYMLFILLIERILGLNWYAIPQIKVKKYYQSIKNQFDQEIQIFTFKFNPMPHRYLFLLFLEDNLQDFDQKIRLKKLDNAITSFYQYLETPFQLQFQESHTKFIQNQDKTANKHQYFMSKANIFKNSQNKKTKNNFEQSLIELSWDIAFENTRNSSERKMHLASVFLAQNNIISEQKHRNNYQAAAAYLFNHCVGDSFTLSKKTMLLNIILTAVILQLRQRQQLLKILANVLQSSSDNLFKFKLILKFLVALRWLDQMVNINYYELFMVETADILDRFCQSFSTQVDWQAALKLYLTNIVSCIKKPDISFEIKYELFYLFYQSLDPRLFIQSAELIWLRAEYAHFCYTTFLCNTDCSQRIFVWRINLRVMDGNYVKASAHRNYFSEYYLFFLIKHFLQAGDVRLALIFKNRLLNSTSALTKAVFKVDITLKLEIIKLLSSKQSELTQLSIQLETCLIHPQKCNKLFLYSALSQILLFYEQESMQKIQSTRNEFESQKQYLKLLTGYLTNRQYLFDIKQALYFKSIHSLPTMVYHLSMIVEASFALNDSAFAQQTDWSQQVSAVLKEPFLQIGCESCRKSALIYLLRIQNNNWFVEKDGNKLTLQHIPKLMRQLRQKNLQFKNSKRMLQVFFKIMKINIQNKNTAECSAMMSLFWGIDQQDIWDFKQMSYKYLFFLYPCNRDILEYIFHSNQVKDNVSYYAYILRRIIVLFGQIYPNKHHIDNFVAIVKLMIQKLMASQLSHFQIYCSVKKIVYSKHPIKYYGSYFPLYQISIYCEFSNLHEGPDIIKTLNMLRFCDYYTKNLLQTKYYHKILRCWNIFYGNSPNQKRKYQHHYKIYLRIKQPNSFNAVRYLSTIKKERSLKGNINQMKFKQHFVYKLQKMKISFSDHK